jgi:hypothetical protein
MSPNREDENDFAYISKIHPIVDQNHLIIGGIIPLGNGRI